MSPRIKIGLLIALSVLQVAATAHSIVRYESTLRTGVLYRVPTAAIDPADAFRGRYVAVRPTIVMADPVSPETEALLRRIESREKGYVVLATDDKGLARAGEIRLDRPTQGDYLEIALVWAQPRPQSPDGTPAGTVYNLTFSFDRYYMNDTAAPLAQDRFTTASRRNAETRAWLNVRVKDGVGVIEGLYVDGVPIEQAIASPGK
jgi:uncharacterized membrane-anchored protein